MAQLGTGELQVVLVQPDGYAHAAAFSEVVESVVYGLGALGASVTVGTNRLVWPGPQPVFFGANLLTPQEAAQLPASCIIYNLEQIEQGSAWCSSSYLELCQRAQVWDYSGRNIMALARHGVRRAVHVPIGYVPELTRIEPAAEEDIDVLFYGSMNPRRQAALSALAGAGLKVHSVFGVYGAERDALIARSKVVLNLHFYETSIFELVRVSYLLANRKAVVAECHNGTEIDADMADAVRLAPYHELVNACLHLVGDPTARAELAERGFARMSARRQSDYLSRALAQLPVPALA